MFSFVNAEINIIETSVKRNNHATLLCKNHVFISCTPTHDDSFNKILLIKLLFGKVLIIESGLIVNQLPVLNQDNIPAPKHHNITNAKPNI